MNRQQKKHSVKERAVISALLSFLFFLSPALLSAQGGDASGRRTITGRVADTGGELLIGVNIIEVGNPASGTVTDMNGTYTMTVTVAAPVLKFSYIGFKDKVVEVGKNNIVDVTLEEDIEFLDEVVVVGHGHQKKASVVGSISTIEPQRLQLTSARSLSNNLAGQLAGIIAVQRSGNPWYNNSDFWIRGISSYAGSTNPLVLVDGIERSLNDLDPGEIESFSVLKDAAASAVYGVRGANGVVMINTKRGNIGTPKVTARFERGYEAPVKLPEMVGSVKYLETMNDIYIDAGRTPMYSDEVLRMYRDQSDPELYPDINWWDVISRDYTDNITFSAGVNGGSDVLRYALNLAYFGENGILETDPNQEWDSSLRVRRYNVRSNVDMNLTKTTLLRINLGGYLQTRNAPPGNTDTDMFFQATRVPPYIHPPVYASGEIPRIPAKANPWALVTQRGYENIYHSKIESLTALEQDLKFITPGLSAKVTFSFDKYSATGVVRSKDPDYYNPASARDEDGKLILTIQGYGQEFLGHSLSAEWGNQSLYLEGSLNYDRTFAQRHALNAMLLYNQREYNNGSALPYRTQGFAGRFSYTYDTRYVAEFNFGYNGSENFAPGHRFGFFPAAAVGWIVSQERFMEGLLGTLSNLKLRATVGQAGNSEISGRRFAYLSTIVDTGNYRWGVDNNIYRLGRAEGDVGVEDLTWETVTKTNLGVEVGLWQNSVNFTGDIFKDRRKDIFTERTNVPGSAGFNRAIWANYGIVDNRGFEMSLNVNRQLTKDWFVSMMANYTYAHNKIIERDEAAAVIGTNRARTGHPVNQLFGLVAERLYTEDDFEDVATGKLKSDIPDVKFSASVRPGDIKYVDINEDGEVNTLDQTAIGGTVMPEIVYGFGANIRYKNIDFGLFFQGVSNTWHFLGGEDWLPGTSAGAGSIFSNVDDRWTVENPRQDVFWPRLSNGANANNEQASTWWLKDMSFLRLKSVELGYTLPQSWTKRVGMQNFRIFARGANLLTFSSFKLWDPELDTSNGARYPVMKSVSVGININFQ
jgi:TonB-linked SusC/RagA family outer membrane protein